MGTRLVHDGDNMWTRWGQDRDKTGTRHGVRRTIGVRGDNGDTGDSRSGETCGSGETVTRIQTWTGWDAELDKNFECQ